MRPKGEVLVWIGQVLKTKCNREKESIKEERQSSYGNLGGFSHPYKI